MRMLFKNIKVVDPESDFNGQQLDLMIDNGRILLNGERCANEVDASEWCVSPGRIDLKADTGQPGNEEAETLLSFSRAARMGGFVAVCCSPLRQPVADNVPAITSFINISAGLGIQLLPLATLTKGAGGKALSEMYDLKNAGAVMFTDDTQPLSNTNMLKIALQYSQTADVVLSVHPIDPDLRLQAHVNESANTLRQGLSGVSELIETIPLQKLLQLVAYTQAPLHIDGISTAAGVQQIRQAKKNGLPVTSSVHVANLLWTDVRLQGFDNVFKVWPPLRSESDRQALIKGLTDGTIDAICSDHRPHAPEALDCEFEQAPFGSIQIQTLYGSLKTFVPQLSDDVICRALYYGPLRCLRMKAQTIAHENNIPLVIYNPESTWTFDTKSNRSLSVNSGLWGSTLKGSTVYTVLGGQILKPE